MEELDLYYIRDPYTAIADGFTSIGDDVVAMLRIAVAEHLAGQPYQTLPEDFKDFLQLLNVGSQCQWCMEYTKEPHASCDASLQNWALNHHILDQWVETGVAHNYATPTTKAEWNWGWSKPSQDFIAPHIRKALAGLLFNQPINPSNPTLMLEVMNAGFDPVSGTYNPEA